jgi:hypothetical protein
MQQSQFRGREASLDGESDVLPCTLDSMPNQGAWQLLFVPFLVAPPALGLFKLKRGERHRVNGPLRTTRSPRRGAQHKRRQGALLSLHGENRKHNIKKGDCPNRRRPAPGLRSPICLGRWPRAQNKTQKAFGLFDTPVRAEGFDQRLKALS